MSFKCRVFSSLGLNQLWWGPVKKNAEQEGNQNPETTCFLKGLTLNFSMYKVAVLYKQCAEPQGADLKKPILVTLAHQNPTQPHSSLYRLERLINTSNSTDSTTSLCSFTTLVGETKHAGISWTKVRGPSNISSQSRPSSRKFPANHISQASFQKRKQSGTDQRNETHLPELWLD